MNERKTKHESEIGGNGRIFLGYGLISSLCFLDLVNWKKAVARMTFGYHIVIENVVALG